MKKFRFTRTKIQNKVGLILGLLTILTASFGLAPEAFATTYMTHATVLEENMNTSATSAVDVAFTAGAADVAGTLTLNFTGWGGTVSASQTITTGTCQALLGATNTLPTSSSLSAAGSGSTVTVSNVAALTSGQSYCFSLTGTAVTNPAGAGQGTVVITDASDTTTVAIDNIANDTVTVTATVAPTFTMALSSNADTFASPLSSSALRTSNGVTTTINTNATSGWSLWALDSNAGLTSASETHTIASVATGSNTSLASTGSEQYALGVTTANATANYADGGGTTGSGLSTTVYNKIATSSTPASNATVTTKELANISATTPAAQDYSDVVTLVGAGSF